MSMRDLSGWFLVDKTSGPTSRDVLNKIQRRWRKLKVGHAGTLDPLATGLLLVAVGSATKLVEITHRMDKSYVARIRLGATSPTDDADGPWAEDMSAKEVTLEAIETALMALTGPAVMQKPPAFSAIHTAGQRAYQLARRGDDVELAARPVRIDRIEIVNYAWPFLDVKVDCGAGTYIRSIARDAGANLGVGGMIETLKRTCIGPFHVENALPIDRLLDIQNPAEALVAAQTALVGWPQIILSEEDTLLVARGRPIPLRDEPALNEEGKELAMIGVEGGLAGLARVVLSGNVFVAQPYRVFLSQD